MDNTTLDLASFFRRMADDIEQHRLPMNQLFEASQFFMRTQYQQSDETPTEEETYKYLCTGWYIHQHINSISNQNPQLDI